MLNYLKYSAALNRFNQSSSVGLLVSLMIGTLQVLLVLALVHERVHLGRLADLHLEQPTLFVARRVDQAGCILDGVVLFDHRAGDRRVELTGRFDRLERTAFLLLRQLGADVGQLGEHHVAECFLRR